MEASRRLRNGEAFGETPGTCRKITRRALRSARNAALSERTLPKLSLERTGKSNERVSLAFSPDGVRKATSRCRLARRADDSNTTYLCLPVGRLVGRAAPLLAAGLGARVTAVLGPRLLAKGFAAPRAEDPGTDARAEEAGLITCSSSCQTFSVHPFFVIVTVLGQVFILSLHKISVCLGRTLFFGSQGRQ